jgi:osmotically-inducible protein OsmY
MPCCHLFVDMHCHNELVRELTCPAEYSLKGVPMMDLEVKKKVADELNYEPSIHAAEIGVAVKGGIVTLTGRVQSYAEKFLAQRAAYRVSGVRAVVNGLEVHLPNTSERTDSDIAREAINTLNWYMSIPSKRIKVKISRGWITLEGNVERQYQRQFADDAVRYLKGVKGVKNLIEVRPQVSRKVVKNAIKEALKRSAELDASQLTVDVERDKVTISGTVRSWIEREEAERAAWAAPGVSSVDNRITVGAAAAAA